MTETVNNISGQQIGLIEYLPNGLVYGFNEATKMQTAHAKKAEVLRRLFGSQQVTVTH